MINLNSKLKIFRIIVLNYINYINFVILEVILYVYIKL